MKNPYYRPDSEDDWESEFVPDYWYRGRNYDLFSALADVRSGGDITPICQPKGFPTDASADVRQEYERWDCDAHSASYLTLHELKKYHREHDFKAISESFYNTMQQMQALVANGLPVNERQSSKVRVRPNPLAAQSARSTALTTIKMPDDNVSEHRVRIVFWFDN